MANLFSGLEKFGLKNLDQMHIFEDEEIKGSEKEAAKVKVPEVCEADLVFEKRVQCPVCQKDFSTLMVKNSKLKRKEADRDLRPRFEHIDTLKYEVMHCPNCGYSALNQYFDKLTERQKETIYNQIGKQYQGQEVKADTLSYEEADEFYQLALLCAVVKGSSNSEKAYICLKAGWLMRAYAEYLEAEASSKESIDECKNKENQYLMQAMEGFVRARESERFPICNMDQITLDYLIAALAVQFKKYEIASRLIGNILTSNVASARVKDRTRDLKEEILRELKKQK